MNVQTKELQAGGQVPDLGTDPIPAAPYYDPAYFELEREAIFRRTWLQIGHVCELPEPGSFIVRPVEAVNASILIVRSKEGMLRAFHNVCTHRGTQLVAQDSGNAARFTCRYHAWTFGLDGTLMSAPDFERFYVEKSACSLPEVHVDVCAGLIFINLADTPDQGLRDYLGPLAEQLEALPVARATTFGEYVYEIDANWKLTFDNFQENYHLRFIHSRSGAAAVGEENPFGYPTRYSFYGPHRTQTIWANPNAVPTPIQAFAFGKSFEFAAQEGFAAGIMGKDYFGLFPNFFLFGSPTQHFSHTVMPLSAGRSRGIFRFYWIGDDDSASKRFAREYAMACGRDIHAEDRAVIEAGQRGLASGALKVIHFQEQEVLCRHFFHAINSRVQAYKDSLSLSGAAA
jgi:phenylpropionate dioxygenase-like ring-hydroxylating dioxygenase large terminal subunit